MELIVVIAVIGILAGVVIVGYGSWRDNSLKSAMQSDLKQAASQVDSNNTWSTSQSYANDDLNSGTAFSPSNGTQITFFRRSYGYCLLATNPRTTTVFSYKNSTKTVSEGTCDVTVSTFAGSGASGSSDGTGTAAQFNNPYTGAIDSAGNIYIADLGNNLIRKMTPSGTVTTVAGSGVAGYADGPALSAQFNQPRGIAVSPTGDLYVSDAYNQRIRKISLTTGQVTTLAGSGATGTTDGVGTAAQFSYPEELVVNASGTIFLVDSNNSRIRQITPDGTVTTLAGSTAGFADGTGTAAKFNYPRGIVLDKSNNLYVTDYTNNRIRKVTPSGVVTTIAGSGVAGSTDGQGTAAQLNGPYGISIDSYGVLYITDLNINKIRLITPTYAVTTMAGSTMGYADGAGTAAQFNVPRGVISDKSGVLYVVDSFNNRIRKIE
ncbi:hypothetical protein IMX07_15585 [bacterium]|nr:hypothetical protein [bacterium]